MKLFQIFYFGRKNKLTNITVQQYNFNSLLFITLYRDLNLLIRIYIFILFTDNAIISVLATDATRSIRYEKQDEAI